MGDNFNSTRAALQYASVVKRANFLWIHPGGLKTVKGVKYWLWVFLMVIIDVNSFFGLFHRVCVWGGEGDIGDVSEICTASFNKWSSGGSIQVLQYRDSPWRRWSSPLAILNSPKTCLTFKEAVCASETYAKWLHLSRQHLRRKCR
jgi:hypothetical protein